MAFAYFQLLWPASSLSLHSWTPHEAWLLRKRAPLFQLDLKTLCQRPSTGGWSSRQRRPGLNLSRTAWCLCAAEYTKWSACDDGPFSGGKGEPGLIKRLSQNPIALCELQWSSALGSAKWPECRERGPPKLPLLFHNVPVRNRMMEFGHNNTKWTAVKPGFRKGFFSQ